MFFIVILQVWKLHLSFGNTLVMAKKEFLRVELYLERSSKGDLVRTRKT